MKVVIHCEPRIAWQGPFASKMSAGLDKIGIPNSICSSRSRMSDVAILLGTTCWRDIEADGGKYLLIDRCSFGDTNEWVSLVWNGHGRRGNHCAPSRPTGERWERIGVEVKPWVRGSKRVLCGQHEAYSPKWTLPDWYRNTSQVATHFRPHPAVPVVPVNLPVHQTWNDVGACLTLNSSVGVEAILNGIPTAVDDEGGMAWPGFNYGDDRRPWLNWLAWTQWHHDEIEDGKPIAHLFASI